ncbi:MAG: hypothetical protein LBN10_09855 [Propionibacteriaceae bacterium]|jgi:multimeric flavodoxin WrbA|nr:hypothetical protein [Propionibacteriaceae bacterium]
MGEGAQTKSTLVLHDLPALQAADLLPGDSASFAVFSALPAVHYCMGCFGCWLRTPGTCVLKDRGSEFAGLFSRHENFYVVSRLVFGGLSPDVKAVLDRSIGILLPFFRTTHKEMHHGLRYDKRPDFHYLFYGDATEQEVATARKLVRANMINFEPENYSVDFYGSPQEAVGALP